MMQDAPVIPAFCSGFGRPDTHALRLDVGTKDERDNPSPNAGKPYTTITGVEIARMVTDPPSVPKDRARWFLPSDYAEFDARSHTAQREHGCFWWLVVDADKNNLALVDVSKALESVTGANITRMIHSSRSATAEERKWRALIPLAEPIEGRDYSDTAAAFFDLLEEASAGVLLPDRALERPGQLVFLPNRGEFYAHEITKGQRLRLTPDHPIIRRRDETRARIARERAAAQAEWERRKAARPPRPDGDAGDVVGAFNAAHSVAGLMARYGYEQRGASIDWRSPYQSSGSFATRDYGAFWLSLSGSDADAEIGNVTDRGHRIGDAFDLFCHFGHGGDFRAAVRAYAEETGMAHERRHEPAGAPPANLPAAPIRPTPYVWRDPQTIPPRQWLFGKHLIRSFVSLTVAPGALGKSSMLTVETLAMLTGRDLMGDRPPHPLRVWSWNGEDPRDELDRRFQAACLHYGIGPQDIGNRYMTDSGRDVPITLATMGKDGVQVATPAVDALIDAIRENAVDVLIVDPFVTSHGVPENDTTGINAVVATWRRIADATGCAIELVHHVNKSAALDTDAAGIYGSRGAGALIDGVRSARYLARMTQQESERFGIDDRMSYFRVEMGKANLAPPDKATWRKMIGVPLHNGAAHWPDGDVIGVCTAWTPPDAFDGMTLRDLQQVQQAIDAAEEPPRESEKADDWAGYIVADVLGLDAGRGLKKADRNPAQNMARAKVRALLSGWIRSGALTVETIRDTRKGADVKVLASGEPVTEADIRGAA